MMSSDKKITELKLDNIELNSSQGSTWLNKIEREKRNYSIVNNINNDDLYVINLEDNHNQDLIKSIKVDIIIKPNTQVNKLVFILLIMN